MRSLRRFARVSVLAAAAAIIPCAWSACAGPPAPPATCTAGVNAELATLIARDGDAAVDGVEVCGTTFGPSRPLGGGPHGGHALIPVRAPLPDGRYALVEVVTNDSLDGVVTAPRGAAVSALGQYYRTTSRQRPFLAGIHETHCATHRGGANGWVVVNGTRYGCR
jgi:hypothetical protein